MYPASTRRALIDFAEQHDLTILADEVYGDLGFEGSVPLLGTLDPDAPIISLSSLSKAYLAPGWRAGWLVVSATPRMNDALAAMIAFDGRLCARADAIRVTAAIRRPLAPGFFRKALDERALITTAPNALRGCAAARARRSTRCRRYRCDRPPEEDYVLALLRETAALRARLGSGVQELGYVRIVFLTTAASWRPSTRHGRFTAEYLRTEHGSRPARANPVRAVRPALTVAFVATYSSRGC